MSGITLYHCPRTRSTGAVWLLEEIGVPYTLEVINIFAGRTPEYLKINPTGKVPALDDPARAAYYYWSVFRPGVLEPAMICKTQGVELDRGSVGWGDWETMVEVLEAGLQPGPYLLGERFSGADALIGGALSWLKNFGILPESERFEAYVERIRARPAYQKMQAIDAELQGQAAPG